jgi:hypothetical protein
MTGRTRTGAALILFLMPLGFGCGSAFTGATPTPDGGAPTTESGADAGSPSDAHVYAMEAKAGDSGPPAAESGLPMGGDGGSPPDSAVPIPFKCGTSKCNSDEYCEKVSITGTCKSIPMECAGGGATTECSCLDKAAEEAGTVQETCACQEKVPGQFTVTCVIKGA